MSEDPVRDLLVHRRDLLHEAAEAAAELVRRYDAMVDEPFDVAAYHARVQALRAELRVVS